MNPTSGSPTIVSCRVPRTARTRCIALLVLTCLVPYRGHSYAQAIDTRAIYAKASDAVVLVLADQITGQPKEAHQGTGVVVSEDGRILSALHVIKGGGRVTVKLKNGDVYDDVRVTAFDERRDLVVLKVAGFGLHKVTLGNSDDVKIGESVALISNPEGLEQSISQGIISGVRTFEDRGYKVLQTTAPASHGSSGGAILNAKGELVAIANSKLEGGENLNFGIPVNYARGMLSGSESLTLAELARRMTPAGESSHIAGVTLRGVGEARQEGSPETQGGPPAWKQQEFVQRLGPDEPYKPGAQALTRAEADSIDWWVEQRDEREAHPDEGEAGVWLSADDLPKDELPRSEFKKLDGSCLFFSASSVLVCRVYNGSDWDLSEITLIATVKEGDAEVLSRRYRLQPERDQLLKPLKAGRINVNLGLTLNKGQRLQWSPASARGHAPSSAR